MNECPAAVELAYMGVHQIFQMALAAEEAGQLSGLQCSLFDAPGKWGRWLSRFAHMPVARPTGSSKLPSSKVHEIPGPLLRSRLASRFSSPQNPDPLTYCEAFEKAAVDHRCVLETGDALVVSLNTERSIERRTQSCVLRRPGRRPHGGGKCRPCGGGVRRTRGLRTRGFVPAAARGPSGTKCGRVRRGC